MHVLEHAAVFKYNTFGICCKHRIIGCAGNRGYMEAGVELYSWRDSAGRQHLHCRRGCAEAEWQHSTAGKPVTQQHSRALQLDNRLILGQQGSDAYPAGAIQGKKLNQWHTRWASCWVSSHWTLASLQGLTQIAAVHRLRPSPMSPSTIWCARNCLCSHWVALLLLPHPPCQSRLQSRGTTPLQSLRPSM